MFIENKYKNWHDKIISNAKSRTLKGYKEKHHIIPRSLGGKDNKENLVELTAREHFIVHMLLCKFTKGKGYHKMLYAFHAMCTFKNPERYNKINSRLVDKIRSNLKMTEQHKKNISKAHIGKKLSPKMLEHMRLIAIGNKNSLGIKRSEETKKKLRLIHKNMIWVHKDNKCTKINKNLKLIYINKGYSLGRIINRRRVA